MPHGGASPHASAKKDHRIVLAHAEQDNGLEVLGRNIARQFGVNLLELAS